MTENLQKALENFKQFVERDLNGKIAEEYDVSPEIWLDNTVNLYSKGLLTDIRVTYNKGETLISISLHEELLDNSIKEFKEFIDNMDDDIFIEACEAYGKNALAELDECLRNKRYYRTIILIQRFMDCVSKIAREKIESMIFKYFPEYREFIETNGIEKINNPKDINDLD